MSLDSIVRLIRCSSLCSSEQWQGAQLYAISAWEIISDNTLSYTVMCRIACFLLSLEREEERSSEGLHRGTTVALRPGLGVANIVSA